MRRLLKKIFLTMSLVLLVFLVFTALVPFIVFSSASTTLQQDRHVKIIGHRGAGGLAPENTLASFKKALEIGVDMIECDVHLSQDDSIVIMHDNRVNRTTDGAGEIKDLTFAYIRTLDAGSHFNNSFRGEKVPTLNELLSLVNGRTSVLIELKWPSKGIYKKLVEQVVQTIRDHHAESWVVLQSFEREYLRQIVELAPDLKCHQLIFGEATLLPLFFDRTIRFGSFRPVAGISSVNPFYLYLKKDFVRRLHAQHLSVFAFTIDDEKKMAKAINLGADGIITNFPDRARKLLYGK
jgi:glycerophosphoryl diester phosphodiesterase